MQSFFFVYVDSVYNVDSYYFCQAGTRGQSLEGPVRS